MKDQIPENKKTERSNQLIALGEEMSREFRGYYLGREEEVLFEEEACIDGETYYVGYTKEYVKAAKKSDVPLDNQLVRGILTKALNSEVYFME